MTTKCNIILTPTKPDIEKIHEWLLKEQKSTNEGFYCNWKIIERASENNDLLIFKYGYLPIGFLVWSKKEAYTEIDIFEIHPNFRRKGLGKAFLTKVSEHLINEDIFVIELYCTSPEAEKFWIKMGFEKFPNKEYPKSDLTYHRPLLKKQLKLPTHVDL